MTACKLEEQRVKLNKVRCLSIKCQSFCGVPQSTKLSAAQIWAAAWISSLSRLKARENETPRVSHSCTSGMQCTEEFSSDNMAKNIKAAAGNVIGFSAKSSHTHFFMASCCTLLLWMQWKADISNNVTANSALHRKGKFLSCQQGQSLTVHCPSPASLKITAAAGNLGEWECIQQRMELGVKRNLGSLLCIKKRRKEGENRADLADNSLLSRKGLLGKSQHAHHASWPCSLTYHRTQERSASLAQCSVGQL